MSEDLSPKQRVDALFQLTLESEHRAEALQEENDRLRAEAARARAESAAAFENGVDAERRRVVRLRNACFCGLVVEDRQRDAIDRFSGMLIRGEDVSS